VSNLVKLAYSGVTLDFNRGGMRVRFRDRTSQRRTLAEDRSVYISDVANAREEFIELLWDDLPLASVNKLAGFEQLRSFIEDQVNFGANTFTLTLADENLKVLLSKGTDGVTTDTNRFDSASAEWQKNGLKTMEANGATMKLRVYDIDWNEYTVNYFADDTTMWMLDSGWGAVLNNREYYVYLIKPSSFTVRIWDTEFEFEENQTSGERTVNARLLLRREV
jgi:hypothetical protein